MPLFETARGTRIHFRLPHATGWAELDQAKAKHDDLLARERELYTERTKRENTRATLAEKDRRTLADAQYEDPSATITPDSGIAQAEEEIADLTRQIEAIGDAIDRAEQAVIAAIWEHREQWMEDVSPEVDDAYAAYSEALATLATARARAAEKVSLFFWLRNFDDADPKRTLYAPVTDPYVVPLRKENGEPYRFSAILAGLNEDAVRPVPQDEQPFIPWGISPFKGF